MSSNVTSKVVSGFTGVITALFEYDTPKIVHIKSKKVGIINRLIQLGILGYIIGFAIIWKKGYQDTDTVQSATTTKVKGVAFTNFTNIPEVYNRVWDVSDYVIPPQENDAFFVTTNIIVTPNQTQSICPESYSLSSCVSDSDCSKGEPVPNGNGIMTGKCVRSDYQPLNSTKKSCEIHAWCPVEKDSLPIPGVAILEDSKRFTVLIKNNIEFPLFKVKRRNILDVSNKTWLKNCRFDPEDEDMKYCPIFILEDIVRFAEANYTELAVNGGVISIGIHWDCNLDYDISYCKPVYTFRRLDDPNAKLAPGWNFRYSNFYKSDGVGTRDLFKVYGIRYILKVTGTAGKFNMVPLVLSLGSGLALLGIATVLCDIIVMYILKKGEYYKKKKYFYVESADINNYTNTTDCNEDLQSPKVGAYESLENS